MKQPKIRSVVPSFFSDEEVVAVSYSARLLLLALACMADDQGVFRYKPIQIRSFAFPADDVNIEELMNELINADVVRRFEADSHEFGALRGWGRHQNPRDPRALHPLPKVLDEFVRLDEINRPRLRKDREPPPWPLRPKEEQPDASTTSPGQRAEARGTNLDRPADVAVSSHVEGRGQDGSGAEGRGADTRPRAESAAATEPGWPGEVGQELRKRLHERLLAPLETFARSRAELARIKPRDLQRGLIQAIVRLSPFEATNPSLTRLLSSDDAARDKTVGQVRAWLGRLEQAAREARAKPAFLAAAMRRGPCRGWELPGFGKQPVETDENA